MNLIVKHCKIDGCNWAYKSNGLCNAHYARLKRFGDPLGMKNRPIGCLVHGCDKIHDARGFCRNHYKWFMKTGDPLGKPLKVKNKSCMVEGCSRPYRAEGYCSAHYERFKKYGDPSGGGPMRPPIKEQGKSGDPCKVSGCDGKTGKGSAFGYCSAHYMRFKKGSDMTAPIARVRAKVKRINRDGYIVWADRNNIHASNKHNGTVLEYRAVMGEFIGRRLLSTENVHHKNGNRADNRIENLELWITAQPSGQEIHDIVNYAKQILERYEKLANKLPPRK